MPPYQACKLLTHATAAHRSPYNYGCKVEVGIDASGNPTIKKWRTMGRHQTELRWGCWCARDGLVPCANNAFSVALTGG